MTRRVPGSFRSGPLFWTGLVLLLAAAAWLGRQSLRVNLAHACQTKQWPVWDDCLREARKSGAGPAGEEWDRLRMQVATNPGDALGLADMARYAGLPQDVIGMDGGALLSQAAKAAPQRFEVLQQETVLALSRQDWEVAVPRLSRLSVRHADPEAARAMGRLLVLSSQDARLLNALRAELSNGSEWVARAVAAMRSEKLPFLPALPFLQELVVRGAITNASGLAVVRALKAEGHWLEAHAVWLQLWRRPLDLIHNGDFEREVVPGAFDWDFEGRPSAGQGVRIERVSFEGRGQVLRLSFTGRPFRSPVLKHDLLLPAGSYRLDSEVHIDGVSAQGEFVWSVQCHDGGRQMARSPMASMSGRGWAKRSFELEVPTACQASTLVLEPQDPGLARSGTHGVLVLDNVRLTRTGSDASQGSR